MPTTAFFVGGVLIDQPRGDAPRPHDLAAPVDIHQKGVQRLGALLDAAFQPQPFMRGEDARKHVERDQPVRIAALAIDREGDADAAEQRLGLGLLHLPQRRRHRPRPVLSSRA